MLTRQQMIDTINGGGSVLFSGRLVTKVENLPSPADLATTDEERAAAEADIDSQLEKLNAEKAKIAGSKKGPAKNLGEGELSGAASEKDKGDDKDAKK